MQSTYHTYKINGKAMLKHTYWFKMNTNYSNELVPQIKEGITKVEWVSKQDVSKKLEDTYASIKELLLDE